jgi:hypothetical protein
MAELPRTLDAFYERTLLAIDNDYRHQAQIALQWIAYSVRPISVDELAEAVIINVHEAPYVVAANRYMTSNDIFNFCLQD